MSTRSKIFFIASAIFTMSVAGCSSSGETALPEPSGATQPTTTSMFAPVTESAFGVALAGMEIIEDEFNENVYVVPNEFIYLSEGSRSVQLAAGTTRAPPGRLAYQSVTRRTTFSKWTLLT